MMNMKKSFEYINDEMGVSITSELYKSLLICMMCNGNLLLHNHLSEETKGIGLTLTQTIKKIFGKKGAFLSCTPSTTPNDILLSFAQIAPSPSSLRDFHSIASPGFLSHSEPPFSMSASLGANHVPLVRRGSGLFHSSTMFIIENPQLAPEDTKQYLLEILESNFVVAVVHEESPQLPLKMMEKFLMSVPLVKPFHVVPIKRKTKVVHTEKEITSLRQEISHVYIQQDIYQYIRDITVSLRINAAVEDGVSPICSNHVELAARACAVLHSTKYVTPSHIMEIVLQVLNHKFTVHPHEVDKSQKVSVYTAHGIILHVTQSIPPPV